jgi:NAD+ synthase (glutamine-hydrolysing)
VPQLRLALAQVDPVVGDLDGNADMVVSWTRYARELGASGAKGAGEHGADGGVQSADDGVPGLPGIGGVDIVAFPEMMLTGYPVEDLALRRSFVESSRRALDRLAGQLAAEGLGEAVVVVGYLDGAPDDAPRLGRPVGSPQNAAAVIHAGRVIARYAKHHLPNYGVFDEFRNFVRGDELAVVRVRGVDVAVVICEDIWQDGGPVAVVRQAGAGLLLVVNGSPYERNKDDTRLDLCTRRAAGAECTLAYVNMVGGQDELVFDGDSLVVDREGTVLARAPQFEQGCLLVDLDLPAGAADAPATAGYDAGDGTTVTVRRVVVSAEPAEARPMVSAGVAPRLDDDAEVYGALVTGLRDYVRKNGFRSVVLGLSGGIDSALTATIACDALGPQAVHGISMPSSYSSDHSRNDAAELAERAGLRFRTVPIAPMVDAYHSSLQLTGLAEENLQARVRGTTLMALSNQEGHLVLATGNKSELAVGYSTLYGDSVGGFAPLKDVSKTLVWQLARWRNKAAEERDERPPIPESSISKPPSAELRPGQLDTDLLPPYDVLDDVLDDYVEQDRGSSDIVAAGFEPALVEQVLRMVDAAEYKRRQYPPGTKISFKAFGRDRRLPITSRWREHTVSARPEE